MQASGICVTWPADGHGEDDEHEEEAEEREDDGQVAAAGVQPELLSVQPQQALLLFSK